LGNHEIGSVWSKWDLHVHTPASVVQGYSGSSDDQWEKFVQDLEALPEEFAVLGVNDYLFLDGYRRLLELKLNGRLQNIETLFPVVEFRLAKFAGHNKMSRINYHLIFSESLNPDVIEEQFLAQIRGDYNLSPEHSSVGDEWKAAVTKDSLAKLGKLIRQNTPLDKAEHLRESDFLLGFNNVNFDDTRLVEILDNSYLRGKYVSAVGKTEWDQYRWNDNSIAEKKTIINSVNAVFTAAPDLPTYERGRGSLQEQGVNSRLFDCSDAHTFSGADEKDRLGNCLTWVKGDPTLNGLKLAIKHYEERVFVGQKPPIIAEMARRPGKYISRVRISQRQHYSGPDKWFDAVDIPLNPELVAVIGNRGMGKSALLDVIALGGNSPRPYGGLSFLDRFQGGRGSLADGFEVLLEWHSMQASESVPLSASHEPTAPIRVKHLPQHFIDAICNEEQDRFEDEIERVVFSHVPEDERLGFDSLSSLVEFRMESLNQEANEIRNEISELNERIAALESEISPVNVARLKSLLEQRLGEVQGMWAKRPEFPTAPDMSDPQLHARISALRQEVEARETEKEELETRVVRLRAAVEAADRAIAVIQKVERDLKRLSVEHAEDFKKIDIHFEDVVNLNVDIERVRERRVELASELKESRASLDQEYPDSVAGGLVQSKMNLDQAEQTLSAPMQLYESARESHREFKESLREVIGSSEVPDSVRYLQQSLSHLASGAPGELSLLESRRQEKARQLFDMVHRQVDLLRELYAPVQQFVDSHPPVNEAFRVAFRASLEAVGFPERFCAYVAHNKRGSFYGAEQARVRLQALVDSADFDDWGSVWDFLRRVTHALHVDMRADQNEVPREVSEQLRPESTVAALYDFLFHFGYIHYRHDLTMGGRPLYQLSSGEKGALLLVFYLLVDRDDCPLLIDQPEENLDNQSVFRILVPFIHEARKRRQVVLVTHNPNIAVVAGAEQLIYCEMDKEKCCRIAYTSGALEDPEMNRRALDVLEGTRPAFASRDETYRVSTHRGEAR